VPGFSGARVEWGLSGQAVKHVKHSTLYGNNFNRAHFSTQTPLCRPIFDYIRKLAYQMSSKSGRLVRISVFGRRAAFEDHDQGCGEVERKGKVAHSFETRFRCHNSPPRRLHVPGQQPAIDTQCSPFLTHSIPFILPTSKLVVE
jgi:hypothetical protein